MATITLFTSRDCKDSLEMKRLLREAEIDFKEQDISASRRLDLHAKKGPVMLVQDASGKTRVVSDILTQLKLINGILIEQRN
ncbi:MAG: glutaredoxin domain-containing protein [Pseudomonadota bacterium]